FHRGDHVSWRYQVWFDRVIGGRASAAIIRHEIGGLLDHRKWIQPRAYPSRLRGYVSKQIRAVHGGNQNRGNRRACSCQIEQRLRNRIVNNRSYSTALRGVVHLGE